jgi:K+-sensing histidine kinase KdpD
MLGKKRIYHQHIQVKTFDLDQVEDEKPDLIVLNDDDYSTDRDT